MLRTLQRASARPARFRSQIPEKGHDKTETSLPKYAVKHLTPFTFFATKMKKPEEISSIHEPFMFGQTMKLTLSVPKGQ